MSDGIAKLRELMALPTSGYWKEQRRAAELLFPLLLDVVEAADQLLVGGCKCLKCQTIRPSVTRLLEAIDREVEA